MTDTTPIQQGSVRTTLVFGIYIDAPAVKIWQALIDSDYTNQYGYGGDIEVELKPGGAYRNLTTEAMRTVMGMGEVAIDGTVVQADPPNRLILDWTMVGFDEPSSRLTWEITEGPSGLTRVTLTHDLPDSPMTAAAVAGTDDDPQNGGGGWPWVLASLKTLLETGKPMTTAGS